MDDTKKILVRVEELENRVALLEKKNSTPTTFPQQDKTISVKEFVLSKKPVNDVQKTLVIAYYLEKIEKAPSFNVDDINRYFRLAKEPVPQNINDKVNMNIRKGHVMETREKKENKKAFTITNSGEIFVESGLKDE